MPQFEGERTESEPREHWHFPTTAIGRRVLVYPEVDSTNTTAAALLERGADSEGTAIVAGFQRSGRGQYGRTWQAAAERSLLMSVLIHPPPAVRRPVILTALAAVAIADSIDSLTGAQARLKWPNDLLVRGKKVCGILIEQHRHGVILGLGLNLTQTEEELQASTLPDAASLQMISGEPVTPRTAAEVVLGRLDREYRRLTNGEQVAIETDWKWRIGLLGHQVAIQLADGQSMAGRLQEMGFDGLELEVMDGDFRVIPPESVVRLGAL